MGALGVLVLLLASTLSKPLNADNLPAFPNEGDLQQRYRNVCSLSAEALLTKSSRYLKRPVQARYGFALLERGRCIHWAPKVDGLAALTFCKGDKLPHGAKEGRMQALTQSVLDLITTLISGDWSVARRTAEVQYQSGRLSIKPKEGTDLAQALTEMALSFDTGGTLTSIELIAKLESTRIEFSNLSLSPCGETQ